MKFLLIFGLASQLAFASSGLINLGPTIGGGSGDATSLQGVPLSSTPPLNGQALVFNSVSGLWEPTTISAGSGTVTSVAMSVPSFLSVSGSPITTSGTLAVSLANQNANLIFAGPSSGGAAAPTFRSLVAADVPALSYISALTGDVTATGPGSAVATLADTTVVADTYGSGSFIPQITVDSKGRLTNVVDIPLATPTGTINTFAGYDNAGALFNVPGRAFDPVHFGDQYNFAVVYDNTGGYVLNGDNYSLTATVASPSDNVNLENKFVDIDPTSTGFAIGTSGNAMTLFSNGINHHGTANTGSIQFINNGMDIGNGTDPITVNGITFNSAQGSINSGVTMANQIVGYAFQPAIQSGAIMNSNVRAFYDNANIHTPVPGHESFSANPNIDEIQTNHNMNAYEAGGTFPLFTGNAGYQGLSVFPQIGVMDIGGFQGVNINPSITTAGSSYVAGINIAMSNVTGFTNGIPYTINVQGGRSQFNGIASGTEGGSVIQTELDTGNYPVIGGGGPYGVNNFGGSFHVASGSPIGGGAFGIGNNLGIGIQADDDIPPDTSGLGLGFLMNGFLTQVNVASGKTMDSLTFMGAGASYSPTSTGGTIDKVNLFRAIGLINGGGTLAINNITGFYVDPVLSSGGATNAWGIRVDDTAADNWFAKDVVVGGSTMKPTNASVGIEVAGTDKALLLSRLATADESALTAVNGMEIYNTDTNKFRCYENGAWADCIGGGGSGANVTLSNLTSPTAINQDLIFQLGNTGIVNTADNPAGSTNVLRIKSGDAIGGASGQLALATGSGDSSGNMQLTTGDSGVSNSGSFSFLTGVATSASASGDFAAFTGGGADFTTGSVSMGSGPVITGSQASGGLFYSTGQTADGNSGPVQIVTGSATGAGAASGILLQIGSGTTRGQIQFQDGTEGTAGYVWTSTDTNGNGAWMAASGGGANVTLSNLTNPTQINQSLYSLTGGAWTIGTFDAVTADLNLTTNANGLAIDTNSGSLNLNTQSTTGVGNSGNVVIGPGAVQDGTGGTVLINGASANGTTAGAGGPVSISGGSGSGTASGGGVTIASGGSTAAIAGDVNISLGSVGAGTMGNMFLVSGASNANVSGDLFIGMHMIYQKYAPQSTAPAVTTCGTSPTNVGNDNAGRITVGSGGTDTVCTITFFQAWANAPVCNVQDETTGQQITLTPTTADLTITGLTPFGAGDSISYHCVGFN